MKFKCEKSLLQEAISIVQKAITGKSTLAVLQGILITTLGDELILTGSDIDLSIETRLDADVLEHGSIVVDSKLFGEIIRKLANDTVEIATSSNNNLEIICQRSVFNLNHLNADDFPNLPHINENMVFNISQKNLKNLIKSTIFAVAQDETRIVLTGVLFEVTDKKLNLVALDGYRLALKNQIVDSEHNINAVIPAKSLNEVSKILVEEDKIVNITFTLNHILFSLEKTKIVSRLLEGDYIKYSSILPEDFNVKIIAKRSNLLDCIERASLVGKEGNTNLIKFEVEEDNLVITSNSQLGKVREEINIILQGQSMQIAFNSKYLIDVLKIMDEDEVIIQLTSSVSPCIIKNKENDNCRYLILPVRLLGN